MGCVRVSVLIPIVAYVSQPLQTTVVFTIEHECEAYTILTQMSRARSYSTLNISETVTYIVLFTSDRGGGKCVCPRLSVCLSVSKITQKRVHGFG